MMHSSEMHKTADSELMRSGRDRDTYVNTAGDVTRDTLGTSALLKGTNKDSILSDGGKTGCTGCIYKFNAWIWQN